MTAPTTTSSGGGAGLPGGPGIRAAARTHRTPSPSRAARQAGAAGS
jgi:hypothetical protein